MNKIYSKTHHHTNSEIKILKAFRIIKTGHAQQKTMWWGEKDHGVLGSNTKCCETKP